MAGRKQVLRHVDYLLLLLSDQQQGAGVAGGYTHYATTSIPLFFLFFFIIILRLLFIGKADQVYREKESQRGFTPTMARVS